MSVSEFKKREIEDVAAHQTGDELDHFIVRDGKTYAGTHLIIDLYDAERLTDKDHMDAVFRACVEACGATGRASSWYCTVEESKTTVSAVLASASVMPRPSREARRFRRVFSESRRSRGPRSRLRVVRPRR